MAKAKVIHSDDAVTIKFEGDRRFPEPSTALILFPGGHVEVTRCSDGSYWAHLEANSSANIVDSRIDYEYGATKSVDDLPDSHRIKKLALRLAHRGTKGE